MRFLSAAFAFTALLLVVPAHARTPPAPMATVSAEGISEYQFDNGLKIVLFPDHSKPVTTVSVTYLVGSRHENYGETGMAHLLEHLVFKGTPTHRDIPGEMKKRGIRFNGTTWFDRTNYFSSFAADPATLEWLLEMEADRMVNSFISRDDLDSEMTVVRNEMESGENSPFRVLLQRLMATAYEWHNYGNSTIGARSDVEDVPITRLQAFYRHYYQPDNAVLVIAGDFEPEAALKFAANTFGKLKKPARTLQPTYTREPAQDGERRVSVRRVGKTPYLAIGYHIPAGRHPDSTALRLLADILGHTPNGRLHQALVETGQATQVFDIDFALDEPGYFMLFAEAPAGADLDALETAMLAQIEHIAQQPITADEMDAARQRLLNAFELSMRDPNRIGVALSEAIAQGDWRLYLLERDRLEQVTLNDVRRVADTYFSPDNRTIGRFIPTEHAVRVSIPEAPSAAELLDGYLGREAIAAGEAFDPTPANIDARTRTFTLSNGAQLAILAKATRGHSVEIRMNLRFGDEHSLQHRDTAADLLGDMLLRGAGTYDRSAISRQLDALKSGLKISGGVTAAQVSATSDRENIGQLLPLIAEVLQKPSLPETEFTQLKAQAITALRNQMNEPNAVASRAMNRHFNRWPKGHPYYVGSFEEDLAALEAVTLAELRAFQQQFYGAASASIAVIGDVDAEMIYAQMEQLFGHWTAPHSFTRIPRPWQATPGAREVIEIADKPNAFFIARQALPIGQEHADYPALVLGNYILGGGSLKSRLADRIRQQDGLSYGVGSQFSASALDASGNFAAYAIAAPENIAKVETAFKQELARLLVEGIEKREFDEALDGLLKARQTARANDGELIGTLADNLYLGRTMAHTAKFEADLKALTPEKVRETLAKFLDIEAMSLFMAGDFSKLKAGE